MLLTIFLAIVFCAAITLMLLSAVASIQDKKFFSSAPKEAQAVIKSRNEELFYGARIIGWTLMAFSLLMILGVGVISIWDGFRSGYTFFQFFMRFVMIFTVYKVYDMVCFDYFLSRPGRRSRRQWQPNSGDTTIQARQHTFIGAAVPFLSYTLVWKCGIMKHIKGLLF